MDRLLCKRGLKEVHPGRGDYYLVRIDAVSDPEPPIVSEEDLVQDIGAEIEHLIRRMRGLSEQQLERQVYRQKAIYLCVRLDREPGQSMIDRQESADFSQV